MTHRGRPESREELEARSKAMRERAKQQGTAVKYAISAEVSHLGYTAKLLGRRAEDVEIQIRLPGSGARGGQEFTLMEGDLEGVIEFLKFLTHESAALKETHAEIEDEPHV
jgi:hypothetical protein